VTGSKHRDSAPRRVSVLGATGSIGSSTLDLLARAPESFAVEALTAQESVDALIAAARHLKPAVAVIGKPELYAALRDGLSGTEVEAAAGKDALIEAASRPVDVAVGGIVGAAGLEPTLAAARHARVLALANKECLVCAGEVFKAEIANSGAALVPVDSEHSAIFQALAGERPERVERLILTASGGPFSMLTRAEMADVSPRQAVSHPKWRGGEDFGRFRDDDEQGAGGDRGLPPVRHARGSHRRGGAPAVGDPFDGGVLRRRGPGADGRARHAHPDRGRAGLARPHENAGKTT
jgi:hypothetical protein